MLNLTQLKIVLLLIISIPSLCMATEIKCFSGGKEIYHGYGDRIVYSDNYIAFRELSTKNQVAVFSDCMLKEHKKVKKKKK